MKRFFAIWLAVLILLPFTAPFSTYDLAGAPAAPLTVAHANNSLPPPAIRLSGRVRIEARSALFTKAYSPVPVIPAHKVHLGSAGRSVSIRSLTPVLRL